MKNFIQKIISFIYPITCSSCGCDLVPLAEFRICTRCKENFPKITGTICQKCGEILEDGGEYCYVCRKNPREFAFDKLRSVYSYEGNLRNLILKLKYSNRTFLAKDFIPEMVKIVNELDYFKNADLIIPVPLSITRRIKRGYNQAALLADGIAKETNKPLITDVLYRKKITKPQFKLSKKERFENIKDSFYAKPSPIIHKKTILLIDDIATTSATASACAKVLKTAGAKKVYVLTLARD